MILKGNQRGGAKQLALHLLKTEENEHVEVHDVRGFVSDDMTGALKEAYAISKGTKCRQFLFSLSLNPPPTESVAVATFEDALERVEKKLGLEGQPRIVVFHEKEGRRHGHAVWSRIDAETMTARNLPFFKNKLQTVSRELYLDHDWRMPRGLTKSAEADPRNFSLAEWQQAKRLGWHARDLKAVVQDCWAISDNRAAFANALGARGLVLARGDRRGHVAVTHEGEVLSVARYAGKRAKDVRAKLGEADNLPGVADARARMAQDMGAAYRRLSEEATGWMHRDLQALETRRSAMAAQHRAERAKHDAGQRMRWQAETRARSARLNRGLRGLWQRLTGGRARIVQQNEAEAAAALSRDRDQRQALIDAQKAERQTLQTEIQAVRDQHARTFHAIRAERDGFNARFDRTVRGQESRSPPRARRPGRRARGPEAEPEP